MNRLNRLTIVVFVFRAIHRPNYNFSFLATFTVQLVQHFMIMFVEFLPNADLLNAFSVWATIVGCVCFCLVCQSTLEYSNLKAVQLLNQ